MMSLSNCLRKKLRRKGAAAVEFAMAAPLLFGLLFALIEFSRATIVLHTLEDAAYRGCRAGICEAGTLSRVKNAVAEALNHSGVNVYSVVVSPPGYPDVGQWQPVTVTVSAQYAHVSWLPLPRYLGSKVLSGSSTLPRETGRISAAEKWIGDTKK